MADDQITQMVNDPDFGKLSPTEQRKALAAHDPAFSKASDEVISQFVSAHHPAKEEPNPLSTALSNMTAAMSGQPMNTPEAQAKFEQGKRAGTGASIATVGSVLAPGAAEGIAGLGGTALRTLLSGAGAAPGVAIGQDNPTAGSVAKESSLYAAPVPIAEGVSALASKIEPMAGPALARVLRLTPKSVQFGREPAQEVLERGLANGSLPEIKTSIETASKQVTSDLNAALKSTKGTVNAENLSLDVANQMGGSAGNRFLKVVDDAAEKLGLRTNQLSNLSAADANALKQEVARQAKFVEGDMRPSIANGGKVFGGKLKDEMIKLNPEVQPLLESSANLTEASKGADYAVRAEKVGQGKGLLGGVQLNKPGTYVRAVTDRPSAPQLLYQIANGLKDHTPISNALRAAFSLVYGNQGEEIQP